MLMRYCLYFKSCLHNQWTLDPSLMIGFLPISPQSIKRMTELMCWTTDRLYRPQHYVKFLLSETSSWRNEKYCLFHGMSQNEQEGQLYSHWLDILPLYYSKSVYFPWNYYRLLTYDHGWSLSLYRLLNI